MATTHEIEHVVKTMVVRNADGIRDLFLSDEWMIAALKALRKRLDDAERDAVRIYFEAIKVVGAQPQIAVMIGLWQNLGVQSEEEAKTLIRLARQAESQDPDVLALRAAEFIGARLIEKPELAAEVLRRIGVAEGVAVKESQIPLKSDCSISSLQAATGSTGRGPNAKS